MPFLAPLYTIFKLYGCSTGKRYFHFLVLDFGHWSVRHHIFACNMIFYHELDVLMILGPFLFVKRMKFLTKGGIRGDLLYFQAFPWHLYIMRGHSLVELTEIDNK